MKRRERIRRAVEQAQRDGLDRLHVDEADLPAVRRELERLGLGSVVRERTNDCLRLAVAKAYEVAYDDTPTADPRDKVEYVQAWYGWAAEHGLAWWTHREWAPIQLERWIASVDTLNAGPGDPPYHAVVMEHDHLLWDPEEAGADVGGTAGIYTEVRRDDVRSCKFLLPVGVAAPTWGAFWQITNPRED